MIYTRTARASLWSTCSRPISSTLGRVDLVVDHHPKRINFKARFADLRTGYGSTATIFTNIYAPPAWSRRSA